MEQDELGESKTFFNNVSPASGSAATVPQLLVIEGACVGQSVDLCLDQVSIGRRPENHMPLPSTAVSKLHARVDRMGDQFFLTDLGSTNGTSVNRVPLKPGVAHALYHGDTIRLGDHVLLFRRAIQLSDPQTGLSTISLDLERVRKEVDDLLAGM